MKSKFVLTEEESKRILSLHKEKIDQERNVVSEQMEETYTDEVMEIEDDDVKLNYKNETAKLTRKLDLTKSVYGTNELDYNVKKVIVGGATFKPTTKGNLVSSATVEDVQTGKRVNKNVYYYCWPNKLRRSRNELRKLQVGESFYVPGGSIASGTQRELKKLDDLCEHIKYGKQGGTPTPTPSKQGCPSIVKSFTDAGYSQITKSRFDELATDNTRVRRYKYCPVTKKNLYFAKPKQGSGGGTNTGGTGGSGGAGGSTYTFDYNQILTAINQKCPGSGGSGGTPEDDVIVNPFGQGAEQGQPQPQVITITDKIYAGL
jgi:hypothetical protein